MSKIGALRGPDQSAAVTQYAKVAMLRSTVLTGGLLALGILLSGASQARAATVQLGDYTVTLQSTVGYTFGDRTAPLDNEAININNDDGDRNFKSGVMASRFQTLEQFGIKKGDYGFRASALAYLDTVYLQDNKNNSPSTINGFGFGPKGFPSGTVATEGRRFEPLAAFVYGAESFHGGQQKLSWQVGRQTITWGETLFSLQGISGLQAPVDLYQAQLLPNPQAQALFLPTGAASFAYDFGNGITAASYWQFEYEPSTLPGVGSYFSQFDFAGPGAQRILVPLPPPANMVFGPYGAFYRTTDIRPTNGIDQFGFSVHDTIGKYTLGAYFVRGIPKTPNVSITLGAPAPGAAGLSLGKYALEYGLPVNAYAVSASTVFMGANVAGEISGRTNQPLVSEAINPPGSEISMGNTDYARGDVVNADLSALYLTEPLPLMPNGATIAGELTWNKVVSVTSHKSSLMAGNDSVGGSFEVTFTPTWYPRSDVEVDMPIGWTNTFLGDSQYGQTIYAAQATAGSSTIDMGLKAIYKNNLTLGANYQRYAGPPNRQALIDRDFVTVYLQKTF